MSLDSIVFKNNIWLASSPFTERYGPIRKAIQYGVGAVVLKSAAPFERTCAKRCGSCKDEKRLVLKDVITTSDGRIYRMNAMPDGYRSVYSTSTNFKCELLTIDESNSLYDRIKDEHPDVVVIASFAPRTIADFESVDILKGDVIEFLARNYQSEHSRPIDIMQYTDTELIDDVMFGHSGFDNGRKFIQHKERVMRDFADQLRYVDRPKLFKIVHIPELDLHAQLELPVDGFTVADSKKDAHYISEDGIAKLRWGKGSISGQTLFLETKGLIKVIRECYHPDKFIAASGGIFSAADAQEMFDAGADAVQLCSVIYHRGMPVIEEFTRKAA